MYAYIDELKSRDISSWVLHDIDKMLQLCINFFTLLVGVMDMVEFT